MAKYKVEYDLAADKVTKTLSFMGKDYTEIWTDNNTCCEKSMDLDIDEDHPDLPAAVMEAACSITVEDESEIMDLLQTLADYEEE